MIRSQRFLAIWLSLGTLVTLPASGASRSRDLSVICVEEGIAVEGSVQVREDVVIGVTPREIRRQVQAQLRFRASFRERIEALSRASGLESCALAGLLQKLAASDIPPGELPAALSALLARHLENLDTAERLAELPDPVRGRIAEMNAAAEVEQVRSLYGCLGVGIVAGKQIEIGKDLILGMPKPELAALVSEIRAQDVEGFAGLNRLSEALHVNRCATASFLHTLGEAEVPVDGLHERLQHIARQHLELVQQWRALTVGDPRVQRLRDQAKAALDRGDHVSAERLLIQARDALKDIVGQFEQADSDLARVYGELGHLASIGLRFGEAAANFKQAHAIAFSHHHDDAARYKRLEAAAYQDGGFYQQALEAYNAAVRLHRELPGGIQTAAAARLLTDQATLYYARTEYHKAKAKYQEALQAIDALAGGKEHAKQRANCLNGLAETALALNELDAAERYFEEALDAMALAFGADAPEIGGTLSNLGRLRIAQGRYADAEALFVRALGLTESTSQVTPYERAVIKANLAGLHFKTGREEEASELWGQILAFYRQALGDEHPLTLGVLRNLAAVERRRGDLAAAEAHYLEALRIWEEHSEERPISHLLVVSLLDGLGEVHVSQGRLDDALARYRAAIQIAEEVLEKPPRRKSLLNPTPELPDSSMTQGHMVIASLTNDMGIVLERKGDFEGAAAAFANARDIFAQKVDKAHPDYGTVTSNLARVLVKLGRAEEAEPFYLAAIAIARAEKDEPKVAFRSRLLAELYRDQCRLGPARERLETAHDIYLRRFGAAGKKTRAIEDELASLDQAVCP